VYYRTLDLGLASNQAPTITSGAAVTVAENTTAVTTVTATDADGQALTYSIAGGADAARFVINSTTGALVFASAPDHEAPTDSGANNVYDVTVRVSDGQGGTNDQALAVTVTNVNEPPALTGPAATPAAGTEDMAYTISKAVLLQGWTDAEGNALSVSAPVADHGTAVVNADGSVTLTPAANYNGPMTLNYAISDGTTTVATSKSFNMTAVNDLPVAGSTSLGFTQVQQLNVAGTYPNDVALGDMNGDGRLDVVTANYLGSTVSVMISDGQGGFAAARTQSVMGGGSVEIALGDVNGDGKLDVVTLGGAVSVLAGDGTGGFSSVTNLGGLYYPSGLAVGDVNGDGRLDIATGSAGQVVLYTSKTGGGFNAAKTYQVTDTESLAMGDLNGDGKLDIVSSFGDVLINNGNGFNPVQTYNTGTAEKYGLALGDVNGDGSLDMVTADYATDVDKVAVLLGNGTGGFGAAQTYAVNAAGPRNVTLSDLNGDGRLDIVTADMRADKVSVLIGTGTGSFHAGQAFAVQAAGVTSVAVGDVTGDGQADIVTANFYQNGAKGATVLSTPAASAMAEDSVMTLTLQGSDVDGTVASFRLTGLPAHGTVYLDAARTQAVTTSTVITASSNAASVYFKPEADWNGSTSLAYKAVDNSGAESAQSVTVQLTVTPVNDTPVLTVAATLDNGTEDVAYTISKATLLQGWSDPDSPTLSVLNLAADHGTITTHADGSFKLTPAANYNGVVTLSYQVSDGAGGIAPASLSLTLEAVNDMPTPTGTAPALASGTEDTPYLLREVDLLAGWSDADGDSVSVSNLACPQGLISDNGNGTWTFTPNTNFNGLVQLTYEVSDGQGSATATSRSFTLAAVNDTPELSGSAARLAAGTEDIAYTVKDSDLLAGWSDVDSATLSVTALSADQGSITRNADGSTWKFTPAANYAGTVVFSYTVQDGTGGNTAATLSLNLAPVNDAPTSVGPFASLPAGLQDHAYTLSTADLVQGYGDIDGDPLTISGLKATHGTVTNQGDGTWIYTPDRGYTGSVGLTYQVIDGQGGSINATQSLRLDVDDSAPRLTGVAANLADGQEDTSYTVSEQDLLAGWSDAESAVLSVTSLQASHGQLSARHANGTWTFTPDTNFNGTVVLSYRVEDSTGSSSPASLNLAIDPINDNPTLTGTPVTLTPGQEDTAFTLRATDLLRGYTDIDAGDSLDVSDLSVSNGTLVASGPGTWLYTPDANFNGTARVRYNVIDGEGGRAAVALDLTVAAVNDTPVLLQAMVDQEAAQDSLFGAQLPEDMFSDVENGDALALSARLASGAALPAWLTFDAATGRFSGTPSAADTGVLQIVVSATDSGGLSVTDTFVLTVQAPRTVTGTSGNDTLIGNSASERFMALAGNDIVTAGAGNDTLDGGAGSDTLTGGLGNDTYVVDSSTDVVTELAGEGTDTVQASLSITLGAEIENLILTGTGNLSGRGNDLNNTLTGNSGANTLDGAAGADTMIGGGGNDTYVVDNAADAVVEGLNLGTADLVLASVNYTLTANVENLTLTGTATDGTGNELANVLTGNSLDNLLDGQAGADRMVGGQGNDRYVVDNLGDLVVEAAGEGSDTVLAQISGYTLAAQVEQLVLQGQATTGTGNADNNTLTANVYDSRLAGDAGNDRLIGLGGHDTLDGGSGVDTMAGGAGNDTYVVDNSADVVIENTAQGVLDTVLASVSYTLGAQVELLTLTGTGAINATGNDLANVLTGNSGNNVLDGQAGADTLIGGAGNDVYIVDNIDDVVTEAAGQGTDTLQASVDFTLASNVENLTLTGQARTGLGNAGANVLTGNALDNLLDGLEGADRMAGGQGNDSYRVDNLADVVVELAGEGTDTVYALVSGYTLGAGVENLTLQGKAVSATGNAGNNVITGNKLASLLAGGAGDDQLTGQVGDDTLDGGTGNDTLTGGSGNDLYRVDSSADLIVEQSGQGIDLVQASVSYTLAAEVENLVLTGTAAIDATGNAAGNALTGNSGDNVLDGGAGADTLSGGRGNDTYRVDQAGDTLIEALSQGTDTVVSAISWTLGANLENLTLSGTAVRGIGNADKNVMVGSAGANVLAGGLGMDTLTGGAGNDVFLFDTTPNRLTNVDTITDFTLGADRIVLDVRVFKGLSVPAGQSEAVLAAGALRVGAGLSAAGDADDRLIFNTSTGALYYDADGRSGLASVQIATLTGVSALDASAFGLTSVDASTLWVG
jgi:Ca2+-binding RTX toxin-like protein